MPSSVVSYADHGVGFKTQSMLLARMFYLIESEKIGQPIYTPEHAQAGTSNKDFLRQFIGNLLHTAFPNLLAYVPCYFYWLNIC